MLHNDVMLSPTSCIGITETKTNSSQLLLDYEKEQRAWRYDWFWGNHPQSCVWGIYWYNCYTSLVRLLQLYEWKEVLLLQGWKILILCQKGIELKMRLSNKHTYSSRSEALLCKEKEMPTGKFSYILKKIKKSAPGFTKICAVSWQNGWLIFHIVPETF